MKSVYLQKAEKIKTELISWRRQLHQVPELGMQLRQTTAYVKEVLGQLCIPYKELENGAGLLASVGHGEKTILLRSDMDGLPIEEESGESFASKNGRMHACGHDMHTAILLGAGKLLKEMEDKLSGKVLLLFQSGEETFEGAKEAVKQGVTENADAAFAMHVASVLPVGHMIYGEHPMSSVTAFTITLNGVGGHGSMPEACVDPINAAAHVYFAFQELISGECAAKEEAVLTIGSFQAGNTANVIPSKAVLKGTLRTFNSHIKDNILRRMNEILRGIDITCRVTHTIEIAGDSEDVVCDKAMLEQCVESIRGLSDSFQLKPVFHVMGSEDFANISHRLPSCYIGLGAAADTPDRCYGQHNPKVRFNEDCLAIGAAAYTKVAVDFLRKAV